MNRELVIKQYAKLKGGVIWESYYNAMLQRTDIPECEIEQMRVYINEMRDCNLYIILNQSSK